MVRTIVRTLLEEGKGKAEAGEMTGILAAKDRTKPGRRHRRMGCI